MFPTVLSTESREKQMTKRWTIVIVVLAFVMVICFGCQAFRVKYITTEGLTRYTKEEFLERLEYNSLFHLTPVYSIRDSIVQKEIPFVGIILGGFMGVAINLWQIAGGYLSFVEIGLAVLPGCFFLLVGFVTGQKVGYGDGLLLVVIGLFTGFNRCALILCISLVLLSVSALVLLCIRKVGKNSKIPFVPFLAVGMGVGFWV